MKRKVHFSWYCTIITLAVIAAFITGIVLKRNDPQACTLLSVITVTAVLCGFYYCPVYVTADEHEIRINRLLSVYKSFRYSDIEAVDTCYPSAGGLRLCGSGGFFGYWGYFSDIIIGQYFGYYADRSQCFYIRLKNKRQYVVSCNDHVEMVNQIRKHLKS